MALQVDQLRWMAEMVGNEVAYVDLASDASITFGEWDKGSNRLARGLVRVGIGPGERVALHLEGDHLLRWITAYAAIHKAGAVAVPTNVRLSSRELAAILGHAGPVGVITSTALEPTLPAAMEDVAALHILLLADDDDAWQATLDPDDSAFQVPVDDGDLADIMYTSGTTGLPKGIAVRHRDTHLIPNGEPPWSGDAWIHCSPLSSFAGITFIYNPMKMGMQGLYLPRFDVDAWLAAVELRRPTCAFLVPAMAQLLVASERWASADLTSLTLVSIGSAPLAPSIHRRLVERLPQATVTNNYSMTEAGSAFTFMPPGALDTHEGSVGMVMPPTEIRIAGEDGSVLPAGEVGEVLIKVGEHHREYYLDPEATAQTWTGEWLRSGDLGMLDDDGYLYIKGRQKDIVIRGGNNIAATEVEDVLYEHDDVLEVAVVGVPHDVLGEDVGAFVVVQPGQTITGEALMQFCADRLADYKVPRHIWFIGALPRNATGKVLKTALLPPPGTTGR